MSIMFVQRNTTMILAPKSDHVAFGERGILLGRRIKLAQDTVFQLRPIHERKLETLIPCEHA